MVVATAWLRIVACLPPSLRGLGDSLAASCYLLQKAFVVSVGNTFMASVRGTDNICMIQKINHLLYRLEWTDMKNQFSKIKKHHSAAAQIRVEDPAEGGGGARPHGC
jgi:hypothetical protein